MSRSLTITPRVWRRAKDSPSQRSRGSAVRRVPFWFVLPALAVYGFVTLVPSVRGGLYGFSDWNGFSEGFNLVGFENYAEIFTDPLALAALGNTFLFAFITMLFQNGLGLALALALNTVIKSAGVLQTIFFAPVVLTPLVCGYIWSYLLSPTGGVNTLLSSLGLDALRQNWLGDPQFALGAVSVAYLWQFTGFSMVIYLAGLKALPAEVIEAAIIDGAGPIRRFVSIVFPLINGAVVITLVLTLINGMGQFDQVYAMTGGGPLRATETISTVVFKVGFQGGDLPYASALATVMAVVVASLAIIQYRTASRKADS
jgi:raffinose/stachyose/melibiose transport system permease protein